MSEKIEIIQNYNHLLGVIDMLNGNINRMCVTNDPQELQKMYEFACGRLRSIMEYNGIRVERSAGLEE